MTRRDFLKTSSAAASTVMIGRLPVMASIKGSAAIMNAAWYERSRRYLSVPGSRVAYVEHGRGQVALFLHGFPLNGYQWRGALERLSPYRRCIAPDFMSMGSTEVQEGQPITPGSQVAMLRSFLDALHIKKVDLVANDSGGMVAQLFIASYPARVRSVLLTNCDVDQNNPPKAFIPAVELAKREEFARKFLLPQWRDKNLSRRGAGMLGSAFTYPERLSDETLDMYLQPIVQSASRMAQMDEYTVSLGVNVLVTVRDELRKWKGPARMVWALKDQFFGVEWADWLHNNLANSRGVHRLQDANLFFPEEMPDVIAEEAKSLWTAA